MKKEISKGVSALLYAILLFFVLVNSFINTDVDKWRYFYQFTQQTNILIFYWLLIYGLSKIRGKNSKIATNKYVLLGLTMNATITFLIVAFVLRPFYIGAFNPIEDAGELFFHQLTPMLMLIFFYFVKPNKSYDIRHVPLVLIYPLIYLIINLIVGFSFNFSDGTKAFAYGFINPLNYGNFLFFILAIIGLIIFFGLVSIGLAKFKNYIESIDELENQ